MPDRKELLDQIKQLLEGYDHEAFSAFCHAYYPTVFYDKFTKGMTRDQQTLILLEHCERKEQLTQLNDQLQTEQNKPSRFAKQLQTASFAELEQQYLKHLQKQYGYIQILGQNKPRPLTDIFTDVYILDEPSASKRFSLDELQTAFQTERRGWGRRDLQRHAGMEVVQANPRLFILGKPGAGKTTFLKWLTIHASQLERIPIFVTLKDFAESKQTIETYITDQLRQNGFAQAQAYLPTLLHSGRALVLFDGLDEVNKEEEQRATVANQLQRFTDQYPTCQLMITCRVAANEYTLHPFTYVEMADFSPAQIKQFVTNWFGDDQQTLGQFMAEFEASKHKGLREMARTPLLLTLLCLTYDENLTFPNRRVEIYEEAIDALLKKWDSSRRIRRDGVYKNLSIGRKRQLFYTIAHQTFSQGQFFIPEQELAELITQFVAKVPEAKEPIDIDGQAVLKAICAQHGIFVQRAKGIYSFAHLTFQEYFTAQQIVGMEAQGSLHNLLQSENLTDGRWKEVILLVASLLRDGNAFCDIFLDSLWKVVADDPEWVEWLTWVDQHDKMYGTQITEHRGIGRWFYFVLAFDLNRYFTNILHQDEIVCAFSVGNNWVNHMILETNILRYFFRVSEITMSVNALLEDELQRLWQDLLNNTKIVAKLLSWKKLEDEIDIVVSQYDLGSISFDTVAYHAGRWKNIIEKNFPLPHLVGEQLDKYPEYLLTCKLLVECLDLLYGVDRLAVENELLKPRNNLSP